MNSRRKGKEYERELRHKLTKRFGFTLHPTPASGALSIKGDALALDGPLKNFAPEFKKQERLNIWECMAQAMRQARGKDWVLIFSRNRDRDYVAMDMETFCELAECRWELEKDLGRGGRHDETLQPDVAGGKLAPSPTPEKDNDQRATT